MAGAFRWKGNPKTTRPNQRTLRRHGEGFEIGPSTTMSEKSRFSDRQPAARGALDALTSSSSRKPTRKMSPSSLLDGLIDEDGVLMADHRLHAVPDDVQHDGFLGVDAHPAWKSSRKAYIPRTSSEVMSDDPAPAGHDLGVRV